MTEEGRLPGKDSHVFVVVSSSSLVEVVMKPGKVLCCMFLLARFHKLFILWHDAFHFLHDLFCKLDAI